MKASSKIDVDLSEEKLDIVFRSFMKEFAGNLANTIRNEVPVNSGSLKKSVAISSLKIDRSVYSIDISVGKGLTYAFAVWKGLDPKKYSVAPKRSKYMIFAIEDWPQYDRRLGDVQVFYFSARLKNNIPPNDFIGRSIKKNVDEIPRIFAKNFSIVIS